MKKNRYALAALIGCLVLLGACSKNEQASSPSAPPAVAASSASALPAIPPRAAQPIVQPAWLRERLPEHTVAYLRIPSAWGLLSAPNGRPLDPALASEPHARILATLREAVAKDQTIAQSGVGPALNLLLGALDSPVEIIGIDGSDRLGPTTVSLLTAQLAIGGVQELNARFAALAQQGTPLLKAPLDAEGKGELATGGFMRFDAASRRLFALIGLTAAPATLEQTLEQLKQTRSHRLQEIERQIDNSGQGLFGWMNLKGLAGIALSQVQEGPGAALQRDLLNKIETLAFGWGTVDGRGRLQVRVEAPQAKLLGYLAARQYRTDIKTAGKPRWTFTMLLPDSERLTAFENNLPADFGAEIAEKYREALATLQQQYGIVPANLLKLLGPELISFEDGSGSFSALRVNDLPAFHQQLDDLAKRFNWRLETLKVAKAEVRHLVIPGMKTNQNQAAVEAASPDGAALLALLERLNTHLYWVEEGPWLVFAEVPQPLVDRAASTLDTDLGGWLKQSQGYVPESALLGISSVTRNAQREVYYGYLGGLQLLGDLFGVSVSLADMPTAGTLKLPIEGAIGLAVDATPDRLGFSINYEQSPVEMLLAADGNAMTGVMVAGILAAIAIPAYEDFTVRSQVASVLAETDSLKAAVATYYATKKQLPKSDSDLELRFEGGSAKYLEGYGIDGGVIVLAFGDQADAAIKEHTLLLTPYLDANGRLTWVCGYAGPPAGAKPLVGAVEYANDIPPKYLPAGCR
ncbi:MAG: pilin [Candidatus Competibacteraceae bacterium]|nr:pilin [Candidatus Competibacteraceae bacterium]